MQFRLRSLLLTATILPPLLALAVFSTSRIHGPSKEDATTSTLELLSYAVTLYRQDVGEYPPNLDALHSPVGCFAAILQCGPPLDPWGRAYRYERLSSHAADFRIWSCGPDGISGTDDDIEAETNRERDWRI